MFFRTINTCNISCKEGIWKVKGKGKITPFQAWCGKEGV